ncbi:hypothetical protein L1049_015448 [Liquidambar formosana]|uniref:Pentatricopeptide repeat-containing protein n=1 Tax=Liquidambar formosana TaxID=63359 RepID=A0AAP0RXK9_LIQFO
MAATLALTYFYNSNLPKNASPKRIKSPKRNQKLVISQRISKSASEYRNQSKASKSLIVQHNISLTKALCSNIDSGCLENALHLFENMNHSDTFVWNVIIRGLTDNGYFSEAVDFYHRMKCEGVRGDNFTYPFVIKACTGSFALMEGQKVHAKLFKIGLDLDVYICNSLIVMYAKLGYIECAERVFGEMPVRDSVSWNSMIGGHVSVGDGWSSLMCFQRMQAFGIKPDRFSIIHILGACSLECSLRNGKEIHCQVIRSGFKSDVMVQTSLIDMYGKCGKVDYAERSFYRISRKKHRGLEYYDKWVCFKCATLKSFACLKRMQEDDKLNPDLITMINLLPSCAQLGALLHGKSIHGFAIRNRFFSHLVLETALVDMYGECGEPKLAECIFGRMTERNLISWNAMIAAYVQNGLDREALELFQYLWNEPFKPDAVTIASILPAYAKLASLREGKQIHSYVSETGLRFEYLHLKFNCLYVCKMWRSPDRTVNF